VGYRLENPGMTEYQIQANTRRCYVTGRELQPGEKFYSVLFDQGGQFVRQDYSQENWPGTPEGAFSFWTGKVPPLDGPRRPQFDDDLLLDCFNRLEGQTEPDRVNFRYVLTLLLMRRKRLKFEEAKMSGDLETLWLRCPRTGTQYQVLNPGLTEEEMAAVQEEVFKVLGWQ
jgi:hypothetical protein